MYAFKFTEIKKFWQFSKVKKTNFLFKGINMLSLKRLHWNTF